MTAVQHIYESHQTSFSFNITHDIILCHQCWYCPHSMHNAEFLHVSQHWEAFRCKKAATSCHSSSKLRRSSRIHRSARPKCTCCLGTKHLAQLVLKRRAHTRCSMLIGLFNLDYGSRLYRGMTNAFCWAKNWQQENTSASLQVFSGRHAHDLLAKMCSAGQIAGFVS